MEWKWSNGEKYERSPRRKPILKTEHIEKTAIQQSLLSENDQWAMNQEGELFVFSHDKPLNKREDTYNRMAEREMIGQIGLNPFSQNEYITDVIAQDQFLKPISTSLEKENEK
jgi:hypothetical protein